MSSKSRHLASLDLGSTKTRVLVAELLPPGEHAGANRNSNSAIAAGAAPSVPGGSITGEASQLRFLGFGEADSQGWNRGTIASLDQVVGSIQQAVTEAENAAGVPVESAIVGVGGPYIQGASGRGSLRLSSRARDVTQEDVWRVMEAVRPLRLPEDREILHVVPQEFSVDSELGIHDPVGMKGLASGGPGSYCQRFGDREPERGHGRKSRRALGGSCGAGKSWRPVKGSWPRRSGSWGRWWWISAAAVASWLPTIREA